MSVEYLQAAMRALWPDRPEVYFRAGQGDDAPVLTHEEQLMLSRVARALADQRERLTPPTSAVNAQLVSQLEQLYTNTDDDERADMLLRAAEALGSAEPRWSGHVLAALRAKQQELHRDIDAPAPSDYSNDEAVAATAVQSQWLNWIEQLLMDRQATL